MNNCVVESKIHESNEKVKVVIKDHVKYSINEAKKVAVVIGNRNLKSDTNVIIPRSIYYRSQEYIITAICSKSFFYSNIKSIEFADNSEITTFNDESFYHINTTRIKFPSSLIEIKKLGFYACSTINEIEFPENSKLQKIGARSFEESSIHTLSIPPSLVHIDESAFCNCDNLTEIIFPSNSKLTIIGKRAFEGASIESIKIPSTVTHIDEDAFRCCKKLKHVEFTENSILEIIDK